MTALIKRRIPHASPGSVDRAMKALGLNGIRRAKGVRTTIPAKDGRRAGDLLDRDFTADAPNRTWVMDFTYVRTWSGFTYVSFIVDVFAQKIIAWHAATSKNVNLVMTPLRMATWKRRREGHPIERDQLIGHADAESQGGFNWSSQHLEFGGVYQWRRRTGARRPAMFSRERAGSGVRIGRYDRRCVHLVRLRRRGRCSGSFGV